MIPKIIHFCWFGDKEIPNEYRKYIHSWKIYNPDYKIICWNEKNYDVRKNRFMADAYSSKKWGFVPDYARLDIIYRYGGIYLDTDVEVLRNLDELLNNHIFVGMEHGNYIALGLGFGAEKGNPLIKELRDAYDKLSFKVENGVVKVPPSPVMQTKQLQRIFRLNFQSNKTYYLDNLTVYAQEYFCPEDNTTGIVKITDNTFLWHHYSGSWMTRKEKLDRLVYRIKKRINNK